MAKRRIDRTSIFLGVVVILFFWELVYVLKITDPSRLPHPFRIFRLFGDFELFRGFRSMLRHIIFLTVPSSFIAIPTAYFVLHSDRLTWAMIRFLRVGIWLPFLLLFAAPAEAMLLTVAVAVLCCCYHYLVARTLLHYHGRDVLAYVGRETILQVLFFSLLSQLWLGYWKWMAFWPTVELSVGFEVLAILAIFLVFINWIFRSNFNSTARAREIILRQELDGANWSSFTGIVLITISCLLVWQLLASSWFHILPVSPLDALKAGYNLLKGDEIWGDIKTSLVEIFLGLVLCCLMTVYIFLSVTGYIRNFIFPLLPLTYISSIVGYLLALIIVLGYLGGGQNWIGFWHKVIAVAFLTFFPFFQTFWGLRDHPKIYRILLALDDALPLAFVGMLFGEAMAATSGLGFMMLVASAYQQRDKALAGFFITAALLIFLSSALRGMAKRLHLPARAAEPVPAEGC